MKLAFRSLLIIFLGIITVCPSCTYRLSLNGASIPANMKTIRVDFFENNAQLVVNTLSNTFTEALKDRIRNTTRLSVVIRGEADANMSGSIVDYRIAPVSIQATASNVAPIAGASSLTITVNVKYVNDLDKKDNFEQQFSQSENFTGDIATHESALITDLTRKLTEDIFNKAFNNW